ncbi:MAG: FAD-dependent oxidoreductase [Prevotella sp.]|nr:FAD-dependent oxidoreductase [Prevotella sp.]
MVYKYDFLIIGAGVAGMSYALKVARAHKGSVCIICKTSLDEANTSFAQGGVASVTNLAVDNFEKHIEDTMIAGDYISDRAAVEQVVRNAPSQIKELVEWGVNFDRKDDGEFDLHREGGHSEFRILHHADDTGAEIQRGLMAAVRACKNIEVKENHFAVEIITQHHMGVRVTRRSPHIKCYGAYVLAPSDSPKGGGKDSVHPPLGGIEGGRVDTYLAKVTLMCTGGCGAVYMTTSNPVIATGDGIAMVYRAKGTVADMEFVQFHPTVLHNPKETHPAYLITEAMRGYGGILKLPNGQTFMEKYDERLSLAPRDIVARAIDKEMKIHGLDHVCLDVTHKDPAETRHHFPNIYQKCLSIGIDITTDYIPVRPAAHYMCGGIKVDLNGQTSIDRLYAIGECSCTGLHGGNRLASNSLIEAVVYADAAARHSLEHVDLYEWNERVPEWNDEGTMTNEEQVLITQSIKEVNQIMSNYVGIVRSDLRLHRAWDRLDMLYEETENLFKRVKASRDICELRNMINVGYLITRFALERKESRGLHYTVDYPVHAYDKKVETT